MLITLPEVRLTDVVMTNGQCKDCFHYGKSLKTGIIGCVIEGTHHVTPGGDCPFYAKLSRIRLGDIGWRKRDDMQDM